MLGVGGSSLFRSTVAGSSSGSGSSSGKGRSIFLLYIVHAARGEFTGVCKGDVLEAALESELDEPRETYFGDPPASERRNVVADHFEDSSTPCDTSRLRR